MDSQAKYWWYLYVRYGVEDSDWEFFYGDLQSFAKVMKDFGKSSVRYDDPKFLGICLMPDGGDIVARGTTTRKVIIRIASLFSK